MGIAPVPRLRLVSALARTADGATEARSRVDHGPYGAGDRLAGKYLLVRQLEEGGMGVVWVAHNVDLDAQVALKLLRPEGSSPDAAERLIVEARAVASLDHPAILRVFDVGRTEAGDPFLVMELLDGEALAETLARERRLDPALAVRLLLPVAGALSAMHDRRMVHRDVKPENIFITRNDSDRWQPKLIDFGLARLPRLDAGGRITQPGAVVGTPGYMPPEQLQGRAVDPKTDIWALCAVLYQTMTGVLPFDGATPILLFAAMRATRPRPITEYGVGDADLWAILERGLAQPGERWASMRELGRALAVWLWRQGVTDDVSRVSLRSTWLDDGDVRRLAGASRVTTTRFPSPFFLPGAPEPPRPAPPPEPIEAAASTAPRAPRGVPLSLGLALAALIAGLLAVMAIRACDTQAIEPPKTALKSRAVCAAASMDTCMSSP